MMGKEDGPLKRAAANAKLGLWEFVRDTSVFIGSEAVSEVLGVPTTEGTSLRAISELYITEPNGAIERAIEVSLSDGKPFSLLSEIETPAGERKWIRTQGQAADDEENGSRKVFGTIQDISDIRQINRVSQESEMTLAQVEHITHIGHFSVSLADGAIFHSDEIKRIFGYEPAEYALSVEDAINAYHPDDRDEVVRLFNRAVETGQGYEFDLRVIQPRGDIRHVHSKGYAEKDAAGKVIRVSGVFQDITERVHAEQALRQSEASLKALIDVVHTAIVVHDKNGEVVLSNAMANHLLAPLTQEVEGKCVNDPAWQFMFEDGTAIAPEELPVSRILRTGSAVENFVLGRRDGQETAWMLVNGVPITDKHGEIAKVIISFVDITQHRNMEAKLHQSGKMRAIGQLAGGVAHDFNNQLMIMLNYAELLKSSLGGNARALSWVEGIVSGASRSAQLTKQMLAFARKGKYVVENVDLHKLILDVASIASHSFDKRISITHSLNAHPATVRGDASQLQNALLNMALNSRDAMPTGGELVFGTERVTLDRGHARSLGAGVEPGEFIRVTIRDTGKGMDAGTQARIFEPFFTTKELGSGTGMGMASVYGTVETHHGAILVDSTEGVGTTITMDLPLTRDSEQESSEPLPAPTSATQEAVILIIDDEEGVAASMGALLSLKGFSVKSFTRAPEAIEYFKLARESVDVVLLDMIMPEMSGKETFHALRAIDPEVKVVLISGFSFSDEAKEIRDAGAAGFLEKPVAIADLLAAIADARQAHSPPIQ